jgi:mono/diheme cytochrome c family protein
VFSARLITRFHSDGRRHWKGEGRSTSVVTSAGRLALLASLPVIVVLAGCGETPSPKFVVSESTTKLYKPAQRAVEAELVRDFGEPNHLIAWKKLPVDFGTFDGVVEETAQNFSDPVKVKLTRKTDSKIPMATDDLRGAGLVWTAGSNSDATAWDQKGRQVPLDYEVEHYDPQTSKLSVLVNPTLAGEKGKLDPPKAGDKFTVLGPMLQQGHKLYMTHCEHCHGVSGDGKGPTASYFDIKPRDYRLGRFKFTSTKSNDRATREDLDRTIRQGIPGTYMPSFLLFKDEEIGPIVEYIRWLAMRGEFEQKSDAEFVNGQYASEDVAQRIKGGESREAVEKALDDYIKTPDQWPKAAETAADDLALSWTASEQPDALVTPKIPRTADSPESRERGRKLFHSDTAKCAQCHGPAGKGDGPQTEDYQAILGTNAKRKVPGLFDDWGNPIKPRDLTSGIYRGGRRPLDIYRRIYSGIKGTPMPPFGTALKDEEIWDIVNYAMSLPYASGSGVPEVNQSKIASASPVGGG